MERPQTEKGGKQMNAQELSKHIEMIKKDGLHASGKSELIKYLETGNITRAEAMSAKCFDCMVYFVDGRQDCKVHRCPLYPYMPYSTKKKAKKELSPEGKKKISDRIKKMHAAKKKAPKQSPK